ncbi:hypothetical protein DRQ25_17780 [Candidatus Fermentibacteria bacterium]|nr:MAG: hypothetical protein DRQ25_17780 [Candidatus Fermentibacteria bacterium]
MKRDLVPLKLLFRWAYGEKLIGHKLNFDKIPTPSARRPHFEDDEWDELIKKSDDWIKLVQGKHKRHVRSRTYLKHYIHILGYTGIRPGTEVQSITWRSIKKKVLSNKSKTAYIVHISKGKTGPRTIILNAELNDHIDALKQFRKKELSKAGKSFNRDEAVFCNFDGTPTHSFKGGFATFLKKYNLQNNFAGKKRVPYSLRHTFATRMIGYSTNHWDLAKYMGTSVALLEKNYVHNNRETIGSKFFDPDPNKGQVLRLEEESVDDVLQGLFNQPNIEL